MRYSETFDWQYIYMAFRKDKMQKVRVSWTSADCFWPQLALHSTPTFHSAVEMDWNLIIPPSCDSLLCWLVRLLLWCHSAAETLGVPSVDFLLLFSRQSSHTGEQHRAPGRASWGGRGCAEEHLRYGLPQGGETRTCAPQWHVRSSRLLQQYVSTSFRYHGHVENTFLHTLQGTSYIVFSPKQPSPKQEQVKVRVRALYTGNHRFIFVKDVSVVSLKTALHTHTHNHNPTHSNIKRSSLPPTECGWFLTSHLLMRAHDLELQLLQFPQNSDFVFEGTIEGFFVCSKCFRLAFAGFKHSLNADFTPLG